MGIAVQKGGDAADLLARIEADIARLESLRATLVQGLASANAEIEKRVASDRVTQSHGVTQPGWAADARELNPANGGTMGACVKSNTDRILDLFSMIERYTLSDGRTPIYSGDLDDLRENSIYNCNESTLHAPKKFPNWFFVVTFVHIAKDDYVTQIAIRMNGPNETMPIAVRNRGGGIWGRWRYVAAQEEE